MADTDDPGTSPPQHPDNSDDEMPFLVVGVGASAGGLEALGQLLRPLPDDTRMAFVVVTHQEARRHSMLTELLARQCPLPVEETHDGLEVAPGQVYVAAPGVLLEVHDGRIRHVEPTEDTLDLRPVDRFLRSLAHGYGERSVAIVLSGSGNDGTLGCREVKGAAGLVLAEEPASASHASMPRSVIDAGLADHVLPPAAMIDMLSGYARIRRPTAPEPIDRVDQRVLATAIEAVHARTGRDFRHYKESTLQRRISHRMAVQQIESPSRYLKYLLSSPEEVELLFRDLLIGVTSFFREPTAWQALGEAVAERLLKERRPDDPLRTWVPGCSTGEEAYSLAMVLRERIEETGLRLPVSIFATDLDDGSIETARYGIYPAAVAEDIGEDRVERFFHRTNGDLQVSRTIRNMLVFAPHDLLSNPPFSNLDLVSCRNVLIYLRPEMQQQLLRLLHYALRPGGLLFLGSSESIHAADALFETVDRSHKVYRRLELREPGRTPIPLRPTLPPSAPPDAARLPRASEMAESKLKGLVEATLANLYAPVSAVVNERGDVFYLHGRTGLVLEPSPGRPRNSLLAMAREGLEPALGSALREAGAGDREVVRPKVRVRTNGDVVPFDILVRRIDHPQALRGLLLVAFRPSMSAAGPEGAEARVVEDDGRSSRTEELEQDLRFTRESLQSTVEELEISNEELRSSMEELQSTNEELQSANEELEASKEELESLNEELTTVNNELQAKVEELSDARDDVVNLLDSTDIATLFLDERLRIRRFSERATDVVRLINSDTGRHLSDLTTTLMDVDLVARCEAVLRTLESVEEEVATREGRWYQMKVLPYRTLDGAVDGVVLTFVDVTAAHEADARVRRRAREERRFIDAMTSRPLAVLDHELRVVMANTRFAGCFGVSPEDGDALEGRPMTDGDHGGWDRPELRAFLRDVLDGDGEPPEQTRATVVPADGGPALEVEARQLQLVGRGTTPSAHLIVSLWQAAESGDDG